MGSSSTLCEQRGASSGVGEECAYADALGLRVRGTFLSPGERSLFLVSTGELRKEPGILDLKLSLEASAAFLLLQEKRPNFGLSCVEPGSKSIDLWRRLFLPFFRFFSRSCTSISPLRASTAIQRCPSLRTRAFGPPTAHPIGSPLSPLFQSNEYHGHAFEACCLQEYIPAAREITQQLTAASGRILLARWCRKSRPKLGCSIWSVTPCGQGNPCSCTSTQQIWFAGVLLG